MATMTIAVPSGSTSGRAIRVDTTASPGTTIHTIGATATTIWEEIFLWAFNTSTSAREINVELGSTSTDDRLIDTVPAQAGMFYLVPGIRLTATATIIRAFGTGTGALKMIGRINRVT